MNHLVYLQFTLLYCFIKFAVDSNSGIELLDNQFNKIKDFTAVATDGRGGGGHSSGGFRGA